ncbi:SAM-dependent methyltransferase [Burkholderia vietnamiensis]|uniref:SAM-dependent methyltransferase n=1 Tax=Burkholderia vietnamiensis TaxID=60552 RepID=UPI000757CDF2|nr:SAM-dependent methyltransferase [Burkholderia vietnamiensis]AOJ14339.1 SAM-dependent methyltransferase [Burkholderia vietnamiensis]KVE25645.1 SAM-dependent methyltransferase [Burkholderia vietnamiensis]KVE53032.1 SAM-dependent methyltransferase [Burkholderia vietnamiensis]KVE82034.1 SAM-dependent methyltransferase [Burkholderia vietnamiensis]MBR8356850.1 SAM-dependent methyltransferase [Burkholderia vietnamiensis]
MSDPTQPPPPSAADFATRDPASASFWDERFARGVTPWEFGGVPEGFRAFAQRRAPCAVLIPGCGSAQEAGWLAQAGWPVRAIDFAEQAVAAAKATLGAHADVVEQADFFAYQPPFVVQWVYERAFLCALPPSLRAGYAARMAELLPAGGLLAGYFFVMKKPKGPPFGIERAELDALLAPSFELIEDLPVTDSLPVFDGHERWLTWRRR